MVEISFRCPKCGASYAIPAERIPAHGARGPCKGCSLLLTVFPDGRVATPDSAPPPPAPVSPREPAPVPPPPRVQPPDGSVDFSCPTCGKSHKVPGDRIPVSGARGSCSGCGAVLFVTPDGRARLMEEPPKLSLQHPPVREAEPEVAPPPPRLTETDPSATWEIRFEDQVLGPFPFGDIRQLVLEDRLPPDRMVRPSGGEWAAAVTFAPLVPLYAPHEKAGETGEESLGTEDNCFQHPGTVPTHLCSQCQRYMCSACVKELPTHDGRKTIPQCPSCGGPAAVLKKRARWTPFYKDIGQVLVSPFFGSAWILFGVLVVMEFVKGLLGCLGFILIGVLQLTFYLHVVAAVAEGSYEMPEWPDKDNWVDMLTDTLKVVFVSLVSLVPLIIIGVFVGGGLLQGLMLASRGQGAGSGIVMGPLAVLFLALAAIYVLYLPICVAIVAVFNTIAPALNPILIGRIVLRIGPPYLYAAGLWVAFFVIRFSLSGLSQQIAGLGWFAPAFLAVYFTLLNAYVLGRVIYENEEKIAWC